MQSRPSRAGARLADLANRLLAETTTDFVQAARHLGYHVGTLHRWRAPGVRGIRLEAVRVGGRWMTSWQALDRFVTALNAGDADNPAPAMPGGRRAAAVEHELKSEGL